MKIIGQSTLANGTPFTVVGVAPPRFRGVAFGAIDVTGDESASAAERALFRSLRKPQDGWTSRWLNRYVSLTLSRWLVKTNLTPNQVSVGILEDRPIGTVEIRPQVEFYDYQAKYQRDFYGKLFGWTYPAALVVARRPRVSGRKREESRPACQALAPAQGTRRGVRYLDARNRCQLHESDPAGATEPNPGWVASPRPTGEGCDASAGLVGCPPRIPRRTGTPVGPERARSSSLLAGIHSSSCAISDCRIRC